MTTATLPTLVQQFFTDRLCTQMAASPNTIASYRDTFRLLLQFASEPIGATSEFRPVFYSYQYLSTLGIDALQLLPIDEFETQNSRGLQQREHAR
jgi:pullulanase/glycogen debranching enzyme